VSEIGDRFYGIALAWWILQKTNSPSIMGFFMAVSVLPGLILGPFSGALIDRWNRKTIIIVADIIRGIVVVVVAWFSSIGALELWHVFSTAVAISLSASFFSPAVQVVIPNIVDKKDLSRANALNQVVGGFSTVIGPILGAAFVSFFGFTWVFLINGLSYLVSAFFEGFMDIPYNPGKSSNNLGEDIISGFRFLGERKNILIIIIIIGVVHLFVGSLLVALPFLAKELSGEGIRNLGNLEMMMGVGMILASILIHINSKDGIKEHYLFLFIMAMGLSFISIGIIREMSILYVIPYMIILFIVGFLIANASVFWQSLLQTHTPNHLGGRVFSVSSIIGNTSLPIAYGIFGILLHYISVSQLMILSGVFLTATALILLYLYQKYSDQ